MLNTVLVLTVCSLAVPGLCAVERVPFEALNGLPTECAAFAATVLPEVAARHPNYRISYRCMPVATAEADL